MTQLKKRLVKRLSIIAHDKNGRAFVYIHENPHWMPFDTRDIGTEFEPQTIWEVKSEDRVLYQAPYQPK